MITIFHHHVIIIIIIIIIQAPSAAATCIPRSIPIDALCKNNSSSSSAGPVIATVVITTSRNDSVTMERYASIKAQLSATHLSASWAIPHSPTDPCIMRSKLARRWTCGALSLATVTVDIWRSAVEQAAECSKSGKRSADDEQQNGGGGGGDDDNGDRWLLVLEDDADLPPGVAMQPLAQDILRRLPPSVGVVWLDVRGRHGFSADSPSQCCTAAMLYRVDFLPSLLRRIGLYPVPTAALRADFHDASSRDKGIDVLLSRVLAKSFSGRSASVPIVGTRGYQTTVQTAKKRRQERRSSSSSSGGEGKIANAETSAIKEEKIYPWCSLSQSWPEWLFKDAVAAATAAAATASGGLNELEIAGAGATNAYPNTALTSALRACLKRPGNINVTAP